MYMVNQNYTSKYSNIETKVLILL